MPIEGLRLTRFRGYRDTATIELKPLTVLLGPNSAGKSSFGQALVGLASAQQNAGGEEVDLAAHNSNHDAPVDFGSFSDLCTDGGPGPIQIGVRTQAGWIDLEFGGDDGRFGLRLSAIAVPEERSSAASTAPGTVVSSTPMSSADSADGRPSGIVAGERTSVVGHRAVSLRRKAELIWNNESGQELAVSFRGLEPTGATLAGTGSPVLIDAVGPSLLASFLRHLRYLQPIRLPPSRDYPRSDGAPDAVGANGEWTPDFLRMKALDPKATVEVFLPPKAPDSIEQAERVLDAPWLSKRMGFVDAVCFWLQHLRVGYSVEAKPIDDGRAIRLDVLMHEGGHPRPLTDLGFGLSQLIPVIVQACALGRDELLVVELPEAQLHPRAQALLGDFFCSIVKGGARLLLETHSEALLQRIRLWGMLDAQFAGQLELLFVDERATARPCEPPKTIPIADELRWPVGFMEESLDAEILLRAARGARKHASPPLKPDA